MKKQTAKPAKPKAPKVPAAPTPPTPAQPAPTLAVLLLATIERWRDEHGLTQTQFENELETVWQRWQ